MGNYINVNLDDIQNAVDALDSYIRKRIILLARMNGEIEQTRSTWRAEDTDAFLMQWNAMAASDGVFTVTSNNIQNYRDLLNAAYSLYKKAQSDSVEQASKV